MAERTTAVSRSIRIAEDEAKWLSVAADKGGVSQNELARLALHRLRKDLGAASRVKPETVQAAAKASKYKLTPRRTASSPRSSPAAASRAGNTTTPKAAVASRSAKRRTPKTAAAR